MFFSGLSAAAITKFGANKANSALLGNSFVILVLVIVLTLIGARCGPLL